jgi:exopolysaccharide/PEP-CTERM locus tyrosine autokinase
VSIVEKALRKLQSERSVTRPSSPHEEERVGTMVSQPIGRVRESGPGDDALVRPGRQVHVDRDRLRAVGLLPPESQAHELADQYRAIKRPLIRRALEPTEPSEWPPQLIMLASALPGDGKTFTCVNLALSMSLEKDVSVLLVDADVAKPQISGMFGLADEPGLLDVLSDPARPVESCVLATDVPRLSILPAGTRSSVATELLASARMGEVVQRLGAHPRRIVLFDSSPILLTSEARVLSALMGQIVVVVKAGVTPQQAISDTIELLAPGRLISLVLNQAEVSGTLGYYYGYNYGYDRQQKKITA